MAGNQGLRVAAEREIPDLLSPQPTPTPAESKPDEGTRKRDIAADALLLALTALSKRFVDALSRLFSLLTIASAFVLWYSVLPNPSIPQLVGLGLYAGFIFAMHFVVRR